MKGIIDKYNKLSSPIKASIWFLICSFLQKGIQFISTPIFTRLMNTSEYGEYNVFTSWESLISIIISLNLFYGVYNQGLVKYENDRENYSSSMQGLLLVLVFFWTIIYLIFKNYINTWLSLTTSQMLFMILLIWLTGVFQFWASEERVEYKYKKLVIFTLLSSFFMPLVSILLIMVTKKAVLGRILGTVIVSLLFYSWMFFSQVKSFKKMFNKKYWLHALSFNIPLIPHYISQTILNSSDRIMIEKIVNASTAGIYSLAYSISLIMTLFNNALMQTISPWIYKKIKNEEIKEISSIAYFTLIMIAIVNIVLIAFAPEAVSIFAPKEYYDAIWIIPPVAMSVFFMYAYDLFAKFEFYYEKTKLIAFATVIGAVINIILNYICINKFGYIAAGYTTLICYMLYAIFHYIFMRKVCKENCSNNQPYSTKIIILITLIFLGIGFAFLLLYNYNVIRYCLIVIILLSIIIFRKLLINNMKKIFLLKKGV